MRKIDSKVNNSCDDCHSKGDVKEFLLGGYDILLCKKCRNKLIEVLKTM